MIQAVHVPWPRMLILHDVHACSKDFHYSLSCGTDGLFKVEGAINRQHHIDFKNLQIHVHTCIVALQLHLQFLALKFSCCREIRMCERHIYRHTDRQTGQLLCAFGAPLY